MSRRVALTLISSLPPSVVALVWALAALYWRSGQQGGKGRLPFAGATYKGLSVLLGIGNPANLRRLVVRAKETGAVEVASFRQPGVFHPRPFVVLTHATLEQLETLWPSPK